MGRPLGSTNKKEMSMATFATKLEALVLVCKAGGASNKEIGNYLVGMEKRLVSGEFDNKKSHK